MRYFSIFLAICFLAFSVSPANANVSLQLSKIATPNLDTIQVVNQGCPVSDVTLGCVVSANGIKTIYIDPNQNIDEQYVTLYHEVGHIVGSKLTAADKMRFANIIGFSGDAVSEWMPDESPDTLNEKFAVAYANAAVYGFGFKNLVKKPTKPKKIKNKKLYNKRLAAYKNKLSEWNDFNINGITLEADYVVTPKINNQVIQLISEVLSR